MTITLTFEIILSFVLIISCEASSKDLCKFGDGAIGETYVSRDVPPQNCGCDPELCVRKCCKMGYFLRRSICTRNSSSSFKAPVFTNKTNFLGEIANVEGFLIGIIDCQVFKLDKSKPTDQYYVQDDGRLWVPSFQTFYENDRYCIDELDGLTAFVCFNENPPEIPIRPDQELNVLGMIISMPFLLATFLVYALLPEPNLHRRALMSYVATLLMGYILLVSVQLSSEGISDVSCNLLGYLIIFFFTVSFFWMNVMCIDMWLAFRGMRSFGDRKGAERKRFIIYCCYAWGMPLVDILIIFLLNTYGDQTSSYYPAIGIQRCFVGEGLPNFLYFYLLAMLILIINIVLFILTGFKIHKVQRETSVLKHSDSKRHAYEDDKQQYKLYVKLLFAMGVNWITEIISWAIGYFWQETPKAVFYFTDFINATYGVFIFFIFVFKRKIWTSLKKRYYICIGKPHLAHAMSTTRGGTRTSNFSTTETGTSVHTDYRMNEMRNGKPEERALNRH
ncbi:G-protein coupled receptor Mth2 isoform X6 [Leptinotarsa decemlineata]|uniref:G-protein coupled receptor Mth2 isoform X6 n=1 Tax=Leptinotarsa decemlineata TaxID=7539 RepID=UPI003D308533